MTFVRQNPKKSFRLVWVRTFNWNGSIIKRLFFFINKNFISWFKWFRGYCNNFNFWLFLYLKCIVFLVKIIFRISSLFSLFAKELFAHCELANAHTFIELLLLFLYFFGLKLRIIHIYYYLLFHIWLKGFWGFGSHERFKRRN